MTLPISDNIIRRKKLFILVLGSVLYFLTCMAKLLVPAIIYDDLLKSGLDSRMIAGTGAAFMYSYAVSQLLVGVFSNRYGGVRILLIGGSLFAAGTLAFPWLNSYPLMIVCRIAAGLGAGTVFLGVVKLLGDLFSKKFALALGFVMLCSYFGPVCGTTPMVLLVKAAGWQMAMTLPGALALAVSFCIILLMRGTLKAVTRGETFSSLIKMLKNRQMWLLDISVPILFGAYYIIVSQIGQKSITDHCAMSPEFASGVILLLTIIVAVNNIGINGILKLFGNRHKPVSMLAYLITFSGAITGCIAFSLDNSIVLITTAFILIAIPAGFFPLFCAVSREINPPEETGLAVALLNFWCFVFIAVFQNISGKILQHFAIEGQTEYPSEAYRWILGFIALAVLAGAIITMFIRKTGGHTAKKQ